MNTKEDWLGLLTCIVAMCLMMLLLRCYYG